MEQSKIVLGNTQIIVSKAEDNTVRYVFSGLVDENFDQEQVPRCISDKVHFNLEKVTGFNSCGIREWVFFIKRFSGTSTLVFEACSVAMIDQINMIPMMRGTAKITSFYAPYHCSSCSVEEVDKMIDIQEHAKVIHAQEAPVFDCDSCKNELEFDAIPEAFFRFCVPKKKLSQAG